MNTLHFLHSKPTCSKQLHQGKIENDIIKFKNIFDVTYICRIHNLKDYIYIVLLYLNRTKIDDGIYIS